MIKNCFYVLWVCLFTSSINSFANHLAPFTSDGCSLFPNGTLDAPSLWVDCCIAHDLAYWAGGTLGQKKAADKTLANCVRAKGQSNISQLMHSGVKLGGSAYYPTFYRWGYGWPFMRGYKALTVSEKNLVQVKLHDAKTQIDVFLDALKATAKQ